jgi:hypothetical protein
MWVDWRKCEGQKAGESAAGFAALPLTVVSTPLKVAADPTCRIYGGYTPLPRSKLQAKQNHQTTSAPPPNVSVKFAHCWL